MLDQRLLKDKTCLICIFFGFINVPVTTLQITHTKFTVVKHCCIIHRPIHILNKKLLLLTITWKGITYLHIFSNINLELRSDV